jgi:hypothetical protein
MRKRDLRNVLEGSLERFAPVLRAMIVPWVEVVGDGISGVAKTPCFAGVEQLWCADAWKREARCRGSCGSCNRVDLDVLSGRCM